MAGEIDPFPGLNIYKKKQNPEARLYRHPHLTGNKLWGSKKGDFFV
jgi:hypothetical protein